MQQVNLYLAEFRPKQEVLSVNQLLMALGAMIMVYIALGWWGESNISLLQQQIDQRKALIAPLQAQKKELEKMVANRPSEDRVESDIRALENDIQNKTLALATLKNSDLSASQGFSQILENLAMAKNRRIWLTGFKVNNGNLVLSGQTVDPKLITYWIEQASQFDTLNRQYSSISIVQNDVDRRVYDFELTGGVLIND
ncbi:MAG: hypothetical protein V2I33_11525 [Kangiellaceae bacterium]|jgi:hypothetical protein|nr:hypothetical protein [Kangiellaceae bacterium]